jgi:hypothetical protein
VQPRGPQVGEIVVQDVEDVGCLVDAAADEAAEQRDIVVRDVAVCNTAGPAAAKVAGREEIVAEGFEVRAVGGSRFSAAQSFVSSNCAYEFCRSAEPARRSAISTCRRSTKLSSSAETAPPKRRAACVGPRPQP